MDAVTLILFCLCLGLSALLLIAYRKIKIQARQVTAGRRLDDSLQAAQATIQQQAQTIQRRDAQLQAAQQVEAAAKGAAADADYLYNNIEGEIQQRTQKLTQEIQRLQVECDQLRQENQTLRFQRHQASADDGSIILQSGEPDFYPQERLTCVVEVLETELSRVHDNSRRQHIIADFIQKNPTEKEWKHLKETIQQQFRDYRTMTPKLQKFLEQLGFEIVAERNHYKIVFQQDSRYQVSFAKTASDKRTGLNIARDICNLLL